MKMTTKEMRETAASTVRVIARKQNLNVSDVCEAFKLLDEFALTNPTHISSKWWLQSTESQQKLFAKEWRQ